MWYGILVALSGSLSGLAVAFYYRYKSEKQAATIVGLQKDNLSLQRDVSDRDKSLAADVVAMKNLRDENDAAIGRLNKTLEDVRADLKKKEAALKVLRLRDPDAVNTALGQLFPPVADANGDKGGGTSGGGTSRP